MTTPASSATTSRTRHYDADANPAEASSRSSAATATHKAGKKNDAKKAQQSSREAFERVHDRGSAPADLAHAVAARQSKPHSAPSRAGSTSAPTEAAPASAADEVAKLNEAALRSAQAQRQEVLKLNYAVARASDQVGSIHPLAERTVGVAGMLTAGPMLLGGAMVSLLTCNTNAISHAADEADRAVSYVAGELGDRIDEANAAYTTYMAQSNAYDAAFQRYTNALQSSDYAAAAEARKQMDGLVAQMKQSAESFGALAASVGKKSRAFDGDAVRVAIHVAASALTLGASAGAAGGAVSHGAAHFVKDLGKHMVVEATLGEAGTAALPKEEH